MRFRRRKFLLIAFLMASGMASAAEALTRIADIRVLPREDAVLAVPVKVRGVVTWWFDRDEFAIQDESGGIWVQVASARKHGVWNGDDTVLEHVQEGWEVEVDGSTNAAGYAPAISPRVIRVLGRKPLPPARPLDRMRFFNGHESGQRVEVRGLVLGFDQIYSGWWLRLQMGADVIAALVSHRVVKDPRTILGAEVLIRGVGGCGFNTRSEFLNARVMTSIPEDLVVEKPAPPLPFAAPVVRMDRLRAFRNDPEPPRRMRVEGVVTCVMSRTWFYLRSGSRAVRVNGNSGEALAAGDRVEAVGFVDMTRHIAQLGGAEVRKIGPGDAPPPETIGPEEIMAINTAAVRTGQTAQPHDYDGSVIRFQAALVAVHAPPAGSRARCRLILKQGNTMTEATLPDGDESRIAVLEPGSEVEVTGVVQLEYGLVAGSRSFLQPVQVSVLLQRADDVVVLQAPPWWTPPRLLAVMGVGALTLGGALLWVWQLRQQVRRKTQELAAEMRARHEAAVEFRATLRERNRLAANLHDTLLQTIGGIGFQLEACEASTVGARDEKSDTNLVVARRMLDVAVDELRGSVWALRSLPLKGLALPEVMKSMAERARGVHGVQIEVRTVGDFGHVPEFVAGNLLLAAQEALNNALKHGQPRTVTLEARAGEKPEWISLDIRDDGVGFVPGTQAGAKQGHFGLAGIRERMERLDGTLRVESSPGRGTIVHLEVPVRPYDEEVA